MLLCALLSLVGCNFGNEEVVAAQTEAPAANKQPEVSREELAKASTGLTNVVSGSRNVTVPYGTRRSFE